MSPINAARVRYALRETEAAELEKAAARALACETVAEVETPRVERLALADAFAPETPDAQAGRPSVPGAAKVPARPTRHHRARCKRADRPGQAERRRPGLESEQAPDTLLGRRVGA